MRTPLVAGNWKMNGTQASVAELMQGITRGADNIDGAEVLVCPPFVFLSQVRAATEGTNIALGAQDLYTEEGGAFTGEIAGSMLADAGCVYVIVGHSERRALMGDSDSLVAAKFAAAQEAGLTPILCVGESLEERKADTTLAVIGTQFSTVADAVGIEAFGNAVVAYEPVWAIGTGETATPDQAQEVHSALRGMAAKRSAKIAADLRLLYGGSVKAANAADLFSMADIDGGLIGGASLDSGEFLAICEAATG
ncbi:MAG: triose-phosphate isomerase [Gammaproteobacteria bacterium]|nr:triose-phosphate isomerase [Gammaproteobacteria bacterium]MDP6615710.1 triose-phosphate isomerase [Gammaproteobacteria bacterium]MDP6695279.1 triose-phosphate isomerase [Gammaproteobacteria bacterium]